MVEIRGLAPFLWEARRHGARLETPLEALVGQAVLADVFPPALPLGLSVSEAADILRVGRPALSNLLNGHAGLSAEMALRIDKAFGPRMEHLMRIQLAYDLAQMRAMPTRSRSSATRHKVFDATH